VTPAQPAIMPDSLRPWNGRCKQTTRFLPFDGAADFVADAEARRRHFCDKNIRLSQPVEIAIVNVAIGKILTG
jgi:hypothetical protein